MYTAVVNDKNFELTSPEGNFHINGVAIADWDLKKLSDKKFHLLINHKTFRVELIKADPVAKLFSFKINGVVHSVELKDKFDLLLEKMGINNGGASKANNVKAPMPGLIIDLRVKEGDTVMPGDALLILEAMKMENLIKASVQSVVRSVKVKKGDSVEKNQVLIEF
jgi:biotin carboxyl carrier protein